MTLLYILNFLNFLCGEMDSLGGWLVCIGQLLRLCRETAALFGAGAANGCLEKWRAELCEVAMVPIEEGIGRGLVSNGCVQLVNEA